MMILRSLILSFIFTIYFCFLPLYLYFPLSDWLIYPWITEMHIHMHIGFCFEIFFPFRILQQFLKHLYPGKVWGMVWVITSYRLDVRDSIHGRGKRFFSTLQRPGRLWGPPNHLTNGRWRLFPLGQSGLGVMLTTHLHLMPRSRIVELYLLLHGVVLNWLSTGKILPLLGLSYIFIHEGILWNYWIITTTDTA
jgi:hypothetical protein